MHDTLYNELYLVAVHFACSLGTWRPLMRHLEAHHACRRLTRAACQRCASLAWCLQDMHTATQLLFFPTLSRDAGAVVRLPRAVDGSSGRRLDKSPRWCGAVRCVVYGVGLPGERHATGCEPNCQSCVRHDTPTGHHRQRSALHRLRIINVATRRRALITAALATGAADRCPTARQLHPVQLIASNYAAPRSVPACVSNASLAFHCSIIYYDNFLVGHKRS